MVYCANSIHDFFDEAKRQASINRHGIKFAILWLHLYQQSICQFLFDSDRKIIICGRSADFAYIFMTESS